MTMNFNNKTFTAAPTNVISDNKDCRIYGDRCHQQQHTGVRADFWKIIYGYNKVQVFSVFN